MNEPRMTPLFFHLLLSLSAGPRHGYALMQEIEERSGGGVVLGPSSLYYALGRLEDSGLIREVDEVDRPAAGDEPHEERRRYYALTARGRERLRDEARVLVDIVAHVRARGILS